MLSRRRRITLIGLVILGIMALASRAFFANDTQDPRFRTDPVSRGNLVASVTATGTVNPVTTVQVGTYVSGPVQAVDADFNSPVKTGERVAKIDPRPFELRVHQAEAALANARARLEKARADLRYKTLALARNRALRADGIVAEDAIDTSVSAVDQARAEVTLQEAEIRQAEAHLEEARVNLGYTDIVSPVDGVVVSRNVDVGQTVAASFQTPTLFVIAADLTKMQVNANVSEADIGAVHEAQRATFSVDAYPDRTFEGAVVQVRNAPQNVQNVITYDVVIAAPNPDLALRPGMTANIAIVIGRRENVLRVPTAALRFRPPPGADGSRPATPGGARVDTAGGGQSGVDGSASIEASAGPRVWTLAGGQPKPIALETGLSDDSHTEVRSGALTEGELVIVGVERSKNGADAAAAPRPPGFAPRFGR